MMNLTLPLESSIHLTTLLTLFFAVSLHFEKEYFQHFKRYTNISLK
jgi:hypothetical protein